MSEKFDFKRSLDAYRARRGEFRVVDVPDLQYLMLDGAGDPNTSSDFSDALETLYPIAYTVKFSSKRELERDYVVPPLEGLWWARDMDSFTVSRDKSRWLWTLMIAVPEWIPRGMFDSAVERVSAAGKAPSIGGIRLETLSEGTCVQTLHVGLFDDEAPVLESMHREFIPAHGLESTGKHHEIYLSDSRRVAPEKQRTILRQPVAVR